MQYAIYGGLPRARYDERSRCIVAESKAGHKFDVTAMPVLEVGIRTSHLASGDVALRWVEEREGRDSIIRYTVIHRVYSETGNLGFQTERHAGRDLDAAVSMARHSPGPLVTPEEVAAGKAQSRQAGFDRMPVALRVAA